MNIDNITSDSMSLTYNGKEMLIKVYEQEIKRLKEEYVMLQNASDEVEEEKDKEIGRLNNIINELEKWLGESIEKHTEDYLDWKYDRNVYLAGSKKLQNVLDKLQELKGVDKE